MVAGLIIGYPPHLAEPLLFNWARAAVSRLDALADLRIMYRLRFSHAQKRPQMPRLQLLSKASRLPLGLCILKASTQLSSRAH